MIKIWKILQAVTFKSVLTVKFSDKWVVCPDKLPVVLTEELFARMNTLFAQKNQVARISKNILIFLNKIYIYILFIYILIFLNKKYLK